MTPSNEDLLALAERADSWNRCWPGNLNLEKLVADLSAALRVIVAERQKPHTYVGGEASVAVCPICDIAGCYHIRAAALDVSETPESDRQQDLVTADDPRIADYERAYQYALHLADTLRERHYPANTCWRPLGDLPGLLTQIDNMIAGFGPAQAIRDKALDDAAMCCEAEADKCDDAVKWGGAPKYIANCKAAAYAMRDRAYTIRLMKGKPE